jgi:UDP-N-acetylglucosamine 2-epimerase (non-hydrolysing)
MKAAPLWAELRRMGMSQLLVHTGQHYDVAMSDVFFEDLALPAPDYQLGVGSGSHAEQTARVMLGLEPILESTKPEAVVVYGDVNSTVAGALVAAKLGLAVVHAEAGLRSRDRRMPEELNRLVTDQLSDLLLTPSADADANLITENIPAAKIVRVGNLMIDTLLRALPAAGALRMPQRLGVQRQRYALVTLHRPSNVDHRPTLSGLVDVVAELSQRLPVIWPVHPRTQAKLQAFGLAGALAAMPQVKQVAPLGYRECIGLLAWARLVLTDSGGLQEETTALGIPCLTLRENTERPTTVEIGTNVLCGSSPVRVLAAAQAVLDGKARKGRVPDRWDGHAGERAAAAVVELVGGARNTVDRSARAVGGVDAAHSAA